ncbi:MAG: SbcC/MukB-like Walker B domain-containing protein [Bacilli bacterium]
MKKLKKLLLINWHYFSFQIMNFDDINFLTGKNASGKTTIIDAIQLLILGDTTGHFFNKSASDKSTRSLKGYLRCEFGDSEDGSIMYLRNGRFSSYVVLEFEDDITKSSFVVGIVFDNYDDNSYDYKFFYYNDKISENNFIVNNIPMDQKALRIFLMQNNIDNKFFETNSSYRDFVKVLFGNLNNNFFSLFKKSIPFSPITNIEQFITEYVCDVKNNIDISSMQENIRNYKKLEIESNEIEKKVNELKTLNDAYDSWHTDFNKIALQKYLINRSDLYFTNKNIEKLNDEIEDLKNEIIDKTNILKSCEEKIKNFNLQRDQLNKEKFESDIYKQKAVYDEKALQIEKKIKNLEDSILNIKSSLVIYCDSWIKAVNDLLKSNNDILPVEFLSISKEFKNKLITFKNESIISEKLLNNFQQLIQDYSSKISNISFLINSKSYELRNSISNLKKEISILESGNKAYNPNLLSFKKIMENELSKKYNKNIEVHFLADLADIKTPEWRMAIETFLYTQRFYLIVEPQYVDSAISIYEKIKKEYNFSEFGILDTEKISNSNFTHLPNSIVEEISCNNDIVKKYLNSLMGNLIKCERIENLRKHNRSITKSGMLYQGFVARQLNFKKTSPFIGNGFAKDQLEYKKEQLQNYDKEFMELSATTSYINIFSSLEYFNSNEVKTSTQTLEEASILPELHNELEEIKNLLKAFNDKYLENLEKNIRKCEISIGELEGEKIELNKDIIQCTLEIQKNEKDKIPALNLQLEKLKEQIKTQFERDWIINVGEPEFVNISISRKELQLYIQNIKNSLNTTNAMTNSKWNSLVEKRIKYNTIYNTTNDALALNNDYYEQQYKELADTKLVEYKSKIIIAKNNAMNQFKNDFLSKLKSNFDVVIAQMENLNDALESSTFGEDSYHFVVIPRPEYKKYYEMINDKLLLLGNDINSSDFQNKYGEAIEDLFRQITFVDSEINADFRIELEKNIEKFTDYRSYLQFDLIVTNQYGNKQSLSRNLLKKSGGETQTPFYISVLASFAQAYRVKLEGDKFNSIRLIIFDEAFSKMDSERITESIKLLRQFGLQAILSAPPEKIADISNLVDKTLCVVRNNTVSIVSEFKELKNI